MIRSIVAAAALAVMLSPFAAQAGEKTVVLNVENATCELCAPIVKRALSRVSGVKAVQVKEDFSSGAVATVTFDDTATTVPALISATTNAGYPSHPVKVAAQ